MGPGALRGAGVALAIAVGLAIGGCGSLSGPATTPEARPPRLDVIWVPSDMAVVQEMLALADIGPDDVVYDLGCGDGRIVIEAARRFGVRAIGIDVDPVLLAHARRNAERAGVTDRVRFVEQDLFATDLAPATVVTLFLSPEVNLRLRPKLLRELRPGARIVSHEHDLGDWRPERTVLVPVDERTHYVFLWRVPPRGR